MWSSVNSSERLSGVSLARNSSNTVTPPSVGFGDVHDRDASFLIVDATHPTLDGRTSRAIASPHGSPSMRRRVLSATVKRGTERASESKMITSIALPGRRERCHRQLSKQAQALARLHIRGP